MGRQHDADHERLFAYIDLSAKDEDVFVRKAIGWALRDLARTRPEAVIAFVSEREATLSRLSRREALKHVGAGRRA